MNCKHLKVAGRTTKYYYCQAKEEAIDTWQCENCPLKITDKNSMNELVNKFFKKL